MKRKMKYCLVLLLLLLTTGCTTYLKNGDGKTVINEKTGQSLTENILCRPTDEETIKLYEENKYDLSKLPYCVCKSDKVKEKVLVTQNDPEKKRKQRKNMNIKKLSVRNILLLLVNMKVYGQQSLLNHLLG